MSSDGIQSPGSVLSNKFMDMDMSASKLSRLTGLSLDTVHRIMCGIQPVTDEIAEKLSLVFGTTQEFWMNLQISWDIARNDDRCAWCKHTVKVVRQANDQVALHANVSMHLKNSLYDAEAENKKLRERIELLEASLKQLQSIQ